jgi:ABC-type nitrate/sulfonate/bicarbonate transport system ATPase subunit/ABC-type transporter Mla maintaining outer membrane lipid asymmetry permease subunit MlaE
VSERSVAAGLTGHGEPDRAELLRVEGLTIARPDGSRLVEGLSLRLRAGETAAVFGASGAGKSTLMAALHDAASLRARGFQVRAARFEAAGALGIVPQRGALLDHLSAAGNIALALRNAEQPRPATPAEIERWIAALDLPPGWAEEGQAVAHVSGGEAQRLAVARTLAGGRKILLLDEPSVGLDPLRVDRLARALREQIAGQGAAALAITHDLEFAAGFADRFLYLDPAAGELRELSIARGDSHAAMVAALGAALRELLARETAHEGGRGRPSARARLRAVLRDMLAPFATLARALAAAPAALARPRDFAEVARVSFLQGLVRPAGFIAAVSLLVGFTLLYIFHRAFAGGGVPVRPDKIFALIGSMHVLALAPPLSGILFAATSGSAVAAWLGGMSLTRQTAALRGLGIAEARYLWLPALLGLALAYVALAAVFTAGMLLGGLVYLKVQVPTLADPWAVVTADLVDPPAARAPFRARALVLVGLYAGGIAADAVAKGASDKSSADAVTAAMVRSVMACTLWIVALELASLVVLYGARGG